MNYDHLEQGTVTELVTYGSSNNSLRIPVWVDEIAGQAFASTCPIELERISEIERKLEVLGAGSLGREALHVFREDNEALRARCSDLEAQIRHKDELIESLIRQNEEKQATILDMFTKILGKLPSGK